MRIEQILKANQPDVLHKIRGKPKKKHKKRNKGNEKINYKKLMEEAHIYKRAPGGAFRQVR